MSGLGSGRRRGTGASWVLSIAAVLGGLGMLSWGCGGSRPEGSAGGTPPARTPSWRAVTLPDLSRMDRSVQDQIERQHALAIALAADESAASVDRGRAFGELGMLLQAAEYYDAAEPSYLNAQDILPDDVRWPYFLAQLYQARGELDAAEAAYTRSLELRPGDPAVLTRVGRLYLEWGKTEAAEPYFERALTVAPGFMPALAGLGQVALERQDYAAAVENLEAALERSPETDSLHFPLANAYRGLGDLEKAEAHLARWTNTEVLIPDPLKQELDVALDSGLSYELRGVRAMEANDFEQARDLFRRGLELTDADAALRRSLHHKLGTALSQTGDLPGAVEQFKRVLGLTPAEGRDEPTARANYSLGVLMASAGRGGEAVQYFQAAIKYQPGYAEARLALADALRRQGQVAASLDQYPEVARLDPNLEVPARLGSVFGLVRLGRHREAVALLEDTLRVHPDQPLLMHALARLLVASPDDHVRDGERAGQIVKQLLQGPLSPELGETMAMSSAELGYYDEAVLVQRDVIASVEKAGRNDLLPHLRKNLALFEQYEAVRTPWEPDDPVFSPGPPIDSRLADLLAGG